MRKVNKEVLEKIKQWEGLRLNAYLDVAGVWTIGYGHTNSDYAVRGVKITKKKAEQILITDVERFEKAVDEGVKVELTDYQFGALVSFAFNVGAAGFLGSTLLKALNKGNYEDVPVQLLRWNKATNPATGKKEKVEGLTNRRVAEIGLWNKGAFVASQFIEPDEPVKAKINTQTKTGAIAGSLGTVGSVATETATQLNFMGDSPILMILCALLVLMGFGLTVYGVIKSVNDKED